MSSKHKHSGSHLSVVAAGNGDAELLAALKNNHPKAPAALYDRFQKTVHRLVWKLLGADDEHDDIVQQVFMHVLGKARDVRDSDALEGWVVTVTVNVSRSEMRRRRWRRLIAPTEHMSETVPADAVDHDGADALRRVYSLLASFPADEQIVFVLRYIAGKPLDEVASDCKCSLATAKRRLQKAEHRFTRLASRDPGMLERLQRSERWEHP